LYLVCVATGGSNFIFLLQPQNLILSGKGRFENKGRKDYCIEKIRPKCIS
jgi:hypothetical protein